MHTRMDRIINGPGLARAVLWSLSPGIRGAWHRHGADAHLAVTLLHGRRERQAKTSRERGALRTVTVGHAFLLTFCLCGGRIGFDLPAVSGLQRAARDRHCLSPLPEGHASLAPRPGAAGPMPQLRATVEVPGVTAKSCPHDADGPGHLAGCATVGGEQPANPDRWA